MLYDSTSIPEKYHNSRALIAADVNRWVSLVEEFLPRGTSTFLVDLGCGTGRFTVPLAEQLGVSVVGVDPSRKMLREAAQHTTSSNIEYREGSAEAIPLETNSAALIFMSNVLHHVKRLDEARQEMSRVLQPKGILFIRNSTLENLPPLYYLQFFPEALQVCREMLWSRSTLIEYFTSQGFVELILGNLRQQIAPDIEGYLKKIESRVYSDLALIPDEAFERGIARMKAARAYSIEGPFMEDVDYFVFQRCEAEK
jgi:ubiquinone/menaquinone biosynthesis C-methylase UbiE